MSAMDPPLQERVYLGLKADYFSGHFIPGRRIDIQELATRHHSSKTPVREAAFILMGEGLFIHHPDGGFLVPTLKPAELIEMLEWHMQLLLAVLAKLKETSLRRALQQYSKFDEEPSAVSLANRSTEIFSSLAQATGNRQSSCAVRRLNERLHYFRIVEAADPILAARDLATLTSIDVADLRKATRRRVEAYHARKIAHQQKISQANI
jgi:DNA-binding GntR family transcriptional regulator